MKKILTAILFTVATTAAFAQTNIHKGDLMTGGNASFAYLKNGVYKETSLGLSPDVGYFVIDNLAAGLRASVTYSKTKQSYTPDLKRTYYNLTPFVRYYFLPAAQKLNLFADAGFGFGQYRSKVVNSESKDNFTELDISAGPAIFLTPATALELKVGYVSTKYKSDADRYNTMQLSVGFQVHLPGGRKK